MRQPHRNPDPEGDHGKTEGGRRKEEGAAECRGTQSPPSRPGYFFVVWLLECPLEVEWLLVRVWLDDGELEGAYWDGTTELPPIFDVPARAALPRNGR
jgi:hypothetical protein